MRQRVVPVMAVILITGGAMYIDLIIYFLAACAVRDLKNIYLRRARCAREIINYLKCPTCAKFCFAHLDIFNVFSLYTYIANIA